MRRIVLLVVVVLVIATTLIVVSPAFAEPMAGHLQPVGGKACENGANNAGVHGPNGSTEACYVTVPGNLVL